MNTQNNVATAYSDGVTRNAWDATLTWNTPSPGAGITAGSSCYYTFTTGPSSKFGVDYYGGTSKPIGASVAIFAIVTIYLSNGATLVDRTTTSTTVSKV